MFTLSSNIIDSFINMLHILKHYTLLYVFLFLFVQYGPYYGFGGASELIMATTAMNNELIMDLAEQVVIPMNLLWVWRSKWYSKY